MIQNPDGSLKPGYGQDASAKSPKLRTDSHSLNSEPAPDGSPTENASRFRSPINLIIKERASIKTARESNPRLKSTSPISEKSVSEFAENGKGKIFGIFGSDKRRIALSRIKGVGHYLAVDQKILGHNDTVGVLQSKDKYIVNE